MLKKILLLLSISLLINNQITGFATATPVKSPHLLLSIFTLPAAAKIPHSSSGVGIKYYSVNSHGKKTLVTASLQYPPGQPPRGGWPILAWAHGTIGLGDNCAYSHRGPAEPARDWQYLSTWLKKGFAIVTSDYSGIGSPGEHAYLDGKMEAHNIVDAVKAAKEYAGRKLAKNWIVVGQSQGGGAAVKTARYATQFEGNRLAYRGGVATGVPANLEYVLPLLFSPSVGKVNTGNANTVAYGLYLLSGLHTAFPQLGIVNLTNSLGKYWLKKAQTECVFELAKDAKQQHISLGGLLTQSLASIPNITNILRDYLGLETTGYDKPLFIGQGLLDTDIFTPGTLKFLADLKLSQQPVTARLYNTDHNGTVNTSLKDSIPFVKSLFTK